MILAHAIEAAAVEPQNSVIRNKKWPINVVLRVNETGDAYKCLHEVVKEGDRIKNVFAPLSSDIAISAAISDQWEVSKL